MPPCLQVVEATFKKLDEQSRALELRDASRAAAHEMLTLDKVRAAGD